MSSSQNENQTISPPQPSVNVSQEVLFETTLAQALAAGDAADMQPTWSHFLNTEFFVAITPKENGPINDSYDFAVFHSPQQAEPYIVVSEYPEKMTHEGRQAIRVRGGGLIHALNPKHSIVVALSQNSFTLPTDLLAWLRSHTQFVAPKHE